MTAALKSLAYALEENGDFDPKDTLFLGAQTHPLFKETLGWQPLKPLAIACEKTEMKLTDEPGGEFGQILFLPGKAREEVLEGFLLAHRLLKDGGVLWVAMPNTAGASRYEKDLRQATPIDYSVSKNKCRVFRVRKTAEWDAEQLKGWKKSIEAVQLPDSDFVTAPGIFCSKKIDPGSALLVQHLPASLYGKVADLGAGWGFLSHHALEHCERIASIDLYEADRRALACAKKNVQGNPKARFIWADVTAGLEEKYDHILMNPPFHTGQKQDVDLGLDFLSVAARSLKPGGTLHLVANRHLPYEAHLTDLGLRPRQIFENGIYKILVCQ